MFLNTIYSFYNDSMSSIGPCYTFDLPCGGLCNMNTDPLCPLVIRIVSSINPVRSQPVGPMGPRGKVISTGLFGTTSRQESNLTSTRRKSTSLGRNFTSTMSDPLTDLSFGWTNGRNLGAGVSKDTTFRTRRLAKSIA